MTSQHTIDITINDSSGQSEGDTADSSSGIITHTLERTKTFDGTRKSSHLYYLFGSKMQIARPTIIAQPLPLAQHFVLCRLSEILHLGPSFHKTLPILPALLHLRLLEDDLREPNSIRVVRLPPGQVTTILAKPSKKG